MTNVGEPRQRRRSRPNVVKRGSTWTYYVHFADADGRRRQHSKGGFKTAREAEVARLRALHALETGAYVKPERLTVAEFLIHEWLPSREPPVLEESTWESYERNIRLHVVPFIGTVPLQKLDAPRLNALYRQLLECGRRDTDPGRARHDPDLYRRVVELRTQGATYESIAEILRVEFPAAESISRHAVAGICRRGAPPVEEPGVAVGLSARSVRYVHTILHAALKDALRWN